MMYRFGLYQVCRVSAIGTCNWVRTKLELHVMNLIRFFFSLRSRTNRIFPLNWESFSICRSCAYFYCVRFEMVQAEVFIFIEIVCAPFRHRNWLWFVDVVVVVVAGSCRFSASASFVLHSSSYSDRNGTGGWARATLIIIKVAEIGRTRRHNVVRWRWLWWMLKTEKLSTFDIWHCANSSFPLCALSLSLCTSLFFATNAFVVRILPHWKWWLAHTSATANRYYYYYYYFELLECIRRSRNKHIFLHRWNDENYSWHLCRVHRKETSS